ncbi:MAG TPA: hypothetical protein VFS20_13275 [Longimicrobium sp.]|nr:hypothetical protein [Longimicrobium sp.]
MRRLISALRSWWNRHPMVHPLAAAALVQTLFITLPTGQVHLAGLAPGEQVVVRFRSDGCFHGVRAKITLTPMDTGLRYATAVRDYGYRARQSGQLSHAQVTQFEETMRHYRSASGERFCTNTKRVVVTRYVWGVPVSRESFVDRSCSHPEGAMDFWELLPEPS